MLAPETLPSPDDIGPKETLMRLAAPLSPCIFDLRLAEDRDAMPETLPGAIRVTHGDHETQCRIAADGPVILFCHRGLKLTHGAAARLARRGVQSHRLTGGIVGWREAGLPLVALDAVPQRVIVPERCDLNDLAHIWAMLRFTYPGAETIEVAQEHVDDVARTFDAVAVTALALPSLPEWQKTVSFTRSKTMATQFAGLLNRPLSALPLMDTLYRGILT
ncbi:MAG: hypothetical protein AAF753_11745 [Pseudomonadota bacterium]